jgi:DNA-binding transcriptional regulator GbsR (MarR family)
MTPESLRFVDKMEAYGVSNGMSKSVSRVLGYLTVSQPARQSADEIQQTLKLSAGSVSTAVAILHHIGLITRTKEIGGRRYYYELDSEGWKRTTLQQFDIMKDGIALAEAGLRVSPDNARLIAMRDMFIFFDEEFKTIITRLGL